MSKNRNRNRTLGRTDLIDVLSKKLLLTCPKKENKIKWEIQVYLSNA
jgi:hypothetical protein